MGVPARKVPRSTGVTLSESRLATSAIALAARAARRHRHRIRLDAHADRVHDGMGRRVDLVQLVVPLGHDEQPGAARHVGQRGGQAAHRDLGPDVPAGQGDRRHVHSGQGHRGARRDPGHVVR